MKCSVGVSVGLKFYLSVTEVLKCYGSMTGKNSNDSSSVNSIMNVFALYTIVKYTEW